MPREQVRRISIKLQKEAPTKSPLSALCIRMLRAQQSARVNRVMMYACGVLLLLFVGVRLALLWDRERNRRKSMQEENPAPSTP